MTAGGPAIARTDATALAMVSTRAAAAVMARSSLRARSGRESELCPLRRTKIWEFHSNLHCSIIGTCLDTGELRRVLSKLGLAPEGATDHELHGRAVCLAGRHDAAARALNKALDARHRLSIHRFWDARSEEAVARLWRESVQGGEIPGAYWATLTHPATTSSLIREAFGEVHMLSHLVGAANRADIKRLRELEQMRVDLEARLARQQAALHELVAARDARIQALQTALAQRITTEPEPRDSTGDAATLHRLISDLERRLTRERNNRDAADRRLASLQRVLEQERAARQALERQNASLHAELRCIEASLHGAEDGTAEPVVSLAGATILYVGGRAGQVGHMRALATRLGAGLLHHDGGVEQSPDRLPGLVGQCDAVMFPVDCTSHEAVLAVKRSCRSMGKRFIPLRSAGLTSFVAALRAIALADTADAAD